MTMRSFPYCSVCGAKLQGRPPIACPACGIEHWVNAKPCAGALVTDADGRLLLLRRATEPWLGRWDIPGGFCDAEEHPIDTAAREAREECGFEVEVTGFLGLWLDHYPDPADADHPKVTLNAYYHARVGAEVGAPDPDETSEVGWFEPDALPPEIAFPHHAEAVLAAWRDAVKDGRTVTPLPDRP
jgi:ADP-ribose pyrophosphatase YjhB (NUDIX family)